LNAASSSVEVGRWYIAGFREQAKKCVGGFMSTAEREGGWA
jgi:hypothetical protein